MAKAVLPWHVKGHEEYLDGVVGRNADALVRISQDGRSHEEKLEVARGLIRHSIVRALQAERGEFMPDDNEQVRSDPSRS